MKDTETRVDLEDGSTAVIDCQVAIVQDYVAFRQVISTLSTWYESNAMRAVISSICGDDSGRNQINDIADAHNTLLDHARRLEETMDKMGITIRPSGSDFHALLHGAYPELKCSTSSAKVYES